MTRLWKFVIIALLLTVNSAQAQGANLLNNPGFDAGMTGAVPTGWTMWGDAESDKESLSALVRSAPYSWRLRKEFGTFTGGGYQTASVQPGATYRFSIYAMIFTCDDGEFVCRNEQGTFSDTTSGGRVRVGIDPTGGTNPYSASVQWSGFRSPFTWGTFEYLSVEAQASGPQITVFTYYTADKGMRIQDAFWDDASLVAIAAPPPTSVPATAVPVERDPQTQPDGAQVHIVRVGQNLWTIARAYDVSVEDLMRWNQMTSDIIRPGDQIIVQPAPPATATPAFTAPPPATASPTIAPSSEATVVALAPTATQAIVNVSADNGDNTDDDGLFRSGVVAMAVMVVIIGTVTIGGILMIIGMTLFRQQ